MKKGPKETAKPHGVWHHIQEIMRMYHEVPQHAVNCQEDYHEVVPCSTSNNYRMKDHRIHSSTTLNTLHRNLIQISFRVQLEDSGIEYCVFRDS